MCLCERVVCRFVHRQESCVRITSVLIVEVPLYRTVYSSPNGVLSIAVPLYRTVYCSPYGVLSVEVPLYRTVYSSPNGVLSIAVPLYRTVYCSPYGVLSVEVSLHVILNLTRPVQKLCGLLWIVYMLCVLCTQATCTHNA